MRNRGGRRARKAQRPALPSARAPPSLRKGPGVALRSGAGASIGCYAACFGMLSPAMKYLPLGVVYAIWAGVGILAAAVIGWFAFDERLSAMQFMFVAMILVGAVGLRLSTNA